MNAIELSRDLRTNSDPLLRRRRGIVALVMTASASMGLIALYQMGIVRHLPEPKLPKFDADKVDASEEAYSYFSTPDAVLGLGSYAVTIGLAALDGSDRARRRPWIPLALLGKVLIDATQAAPLTRDQWTKHKAFCFWCLLAATATFATVPLAAAEARLAIRQVARRFQ